MLTEEQVGITHYANSAPGFRGILKQRFVHSYQSFLWNHAASKRISLYGLDKVVEGDLVVCTDPTNICVDSKGSSAWDDEKRGCEDVRVEDDDEDDEDEIVLDASANYVRHITADEVSNQKFGIHDVVLPLPSSKTLLPKNDVATTYEELAKKDSLNFHECCHNVKDFSFVYLPGSYRRLIQETKELNWKLLNYETDSQDLAETDWDRINRKQEKATSSEMITTCTPGCPSETKEEGASSLKQTALQVRFTLPSSCYATMALRELTKTPSSVQYHKMLTESSSQTDTF